METVLQLSADLGLANMITFYTLDPPHVERIMRGSRLMRAKWDEARPGSTWLRDTINRACRREGHNTGTPPARPANHAASETVTRVVPGGRRAGRYAVRRSW